MKRQSLLLLLMFSTCLGQAQPLLTQHDDMLQRGPYVLYKPSQIAVNYFDGKEVGEAQLRRETYSPNQWQSIKLKVATDIPGKFFTVALKEHHHNEKAEYAKPKQLLAISDIEGEFGALRKLLQGNGVIGDDLQWTFGKGHLVLNGDFVDRGPMVPEVLWLIYKLETEAAQQGGKVHFILGNHELMNMQGDHRYVPTADMNHSKLMNEPYMHLFSASAELGRWLATKNLAERVGDLLFVHGGMSAYMNVMALSLEQLNKMARPWYDDSTYKFPNPMVDVIFSGDGPMWYRGYYDSKDEKAMQAQIDSTLDLYRVRSIVTGHTVIAHQITSLHKQKLINIDVHHAGGHSEALLLTDNKLYRVNSKGEKTSL